MMRSVGCGMRLMHPDPAAGPPQSSAAPIDEVRRRLNILPKG
jgi:hypothetical protein